jgi:hypothetical protein
MTSAVRGLGFAASLLLISTAAVVPQASAQSTSSTAAHVYIQIQGPSGAIYGFDASSTGKLTVMPGAPWKVTGQIVGNNRSQLITLGTDNIHSYAVESNGAIGSQLARMPILDYPGSGCGGGTSGQDAAVLDHTGKYVYVTLQNGGDGLCAAYQSYVINKDGSFSFDEDTEKTWPSEMDFGDFGFTLPSILGNESLAYAQYSDNFGPILSGFQRESSGVLEYMSNFSTTMPAINGNYYVPSSPDASPTGNYVVLQLYPGNSNPPQLGSFTVDSEGNLTTTNTSSNMPSSTLDAPVSTFSPSGNMFVTYVDNGPDGNNINGGGNGIQIFHFNGAAPLTPYKTLLTGTPIDQVVWDSSNHLYAISKSNNMLYVYTVTPTSVTQDTAWSIGGPFKMIVVSE